jgi:replicative DNA helicase
MIMEIAPITSRIRDLNLAAALVTAGFEINQTNYDSAGRAYFVFTQSEKLELTVNEYWADSLRVRARKYSDNIKMLKSRIYAER